MLEPATLGDAYADNFFIFISSDNWRQEGVGDYEIE